MRIGIFGGSFNPPHKMHFQIAEYLIKNNYLDKVIFVPTGSKYKYKNNLVEDKHRFKMLKIMLKHTKNFLVSNYELKNRTVYTYETLNHFQKKYKKDEIYFICGVDNLSYIDEWKNATNILNNYKILVVDRNTNKLATIMQKLAKYKDNIILTSIIPTDISSTTIRKLISLEKTSKLTSFLDKNVLEYITKKNLYQNVIEKKEFIIIPSEVSVYGK